MYSEDDLVMISALQHFLFSPRQCVLDDELTRIASLFELILDSRSFLKLTPSKEVDLLHLHERTGCPLGKEDSIEERNMESFFSVFLGKVLTS